MSKPKRVVPAILAENPRDLQAMLHQSETFTNYVQIDIMDGQFVPSRSITWKDIAKLSPRLRWDAHLMVVHPEDHVKAFQRVGAHMITFHYEATERPKEVILKIRNLGLEVGLAVNPETPVSAVIPLADMVDSVLFLSVHPGFYGAKFLPEVLDKIREFRTARLNQEIGIDGGIKENNIVQIARSGADSIHVGSAIFLQPNPGERFRHLTSLIQDK